MNAITFINIVALHLVLINHHNDYIHIYIYIYIYSIYIYINIINKYVLIYMLLTCKFQDMRVKMLLTVRQYDKSKSAVFVSFCVRIRIRIVGLGESLIH